MEYASPGAELHFRYDVSEFLGTGETVSTYTWTAETGLTVSSQVDADSYSDAKVTTDASYLGKTLSVEVEAVTSKPNTFKRVWFVKIQDQLA